MTTYTDIQPTEFRITIRGLWSAYALGNGQKIHTVQAQYLDDAVAELHRQGVDLRAITKAEFKVLGEVDRWKVFTSEEIKSSIELLEDKPP